LDMPVYMTTEHGPHATQTRNICMTYQLISYISGTFAIDFKVKKKYFLKNEKAESRIDLGLKQMCF
jgi:hypothetical protein